MGVAARPVALSMLTLAAVPMPLVRQLRGRIADVRMMQQAIE